MTYGSGKATLVGLDPNDPRPLYEQVASAIRDTITTGALRPGDRLPSRAELAKKYAVAHMTVQSALRELRDGGWIVSRQGSGVFVRERRQSSGRPPHAVSPETFTAALHQEDDQWIARCLEVDTAAARGPTIPEALANLSAAVELYLDGYPDPEVSPTPLVTSFRIGASQHS